MSENNDYINDFLNKMWSGDMLSLTNAEINSIIKNMMWQTFLIDVHDISVKTSISEGHGIVNIEIEGEMFMDMANLLNDKNLLDILNIEDNYNEDEDDN